MDKKELVKNMLKKLIAQEEILSMYEEEVRKLPNSKNITAYSNLAKSYITNCSILASLVGYDKEDSDFEGERRKIIDKIITVTSKEDFTNEPPSSQDY